MVTKSHPQNVARGNQSKEKKRKHRALRQWLGLRELKRNIPYQSTFAATFKLNSYVQ